MDGKEKGRWAPCISVSTRQRHTPTHSYQFTCGCLFVSGMGLAVSLSLVPHKPFVSSSPRDKHLMRSLSLKISHICLKR